MGDDIVSQYTDLPQAEEASWSNGRGFYGLLSQLMFSLARAELQRDMPNTLLHLQNIFSWVYKLFNEKERDEIEKELQQIENYLVNITKYQDLNAPKKVMENTFLARKQLYKTKIKLVGEMTDANLLITRKLKGDDWLS